MAPNILMILAHPNFEKSIANKHISNIVLASGQTTVRNLIDLYPDFKINVKVEQEILLKADVIVFQYPLFWYGVPSLLKEWIDSVFTYGFAFGKGTYQLEGKKIIVSFTTGSSEKDYPEEVIEKIVFPFKGLADYCKMEYLTTLISHEIAGYSEEAIHKSKINADIHAKKILEII
ncbi:MAG: NAD(P)H-dependent oxidoreductase [Flavobacteriales bacterium]